MWYATGTVAVTNGDGNVAGTGTLWLTNDTARAGQAILIRDAAGTTRFHEITARTGEGAITISPVYGGITASGLSYKIVPVPGEFIDLAEQVAALIEASASLAGITLFAKDIIQFDGTAYVARTPLQYFTDLSNALNEVDVPSAGTCDIGAALSPKVRITGAVTITSLGTVINCLRFVRFAAALTLTHNATSLILPGNANIVTAADDTAIFMSNGAGNWRCISYQRQPASIVGLTPADLDIIQYRGAAYASRTPLQYFTDLSNALVEVDVASAATCDIGAAASPKVRITGTTTITSLGTGANRWRLVRFGAVLTLTYNATSLILPGNANIVTAAEDRAEFVSDGSGNWRCINYQRQATAP